MRKLFLLIFGLMFMVIAYLGPPVPEAVSVSTDVEYNMPGEMVSVPIVETIITAGAEYSVLKCPIHEMSYEYGQTAEKNYLPKMKLQYGPSDANIYKDKEQLSQAVISVNYLEFEELSILYSFYIDDPQISKSFHVNPVKFEVLSKFPSSNGNGFTARNVIT